MRYGMDKHTGKKIDALTHLKQSINDVLTTPIGSRVMRRDYGSELFKLVDKPMSGQLSSDCIAASAKALRKWEPRVLVKKITIINVQQGVLEFDLTCRHKLTGALIEIEGIKL
jgi:phage baseplate assembly protein W